MQDVSALERDAQLMARDVEVVVGVVVEVRAEVELTGEDKKKYNCDASNILSMCFLDLQLHRRRPVFRLRLLPRGGGRASHEGPR